MKASAMLKTLVFYVIQRLVYDFCLYIVGNFVEKVEVSLRIPTWGYWAPVLPKLEMKLKFTMIIVNKKKIEPNWFSHLNWSSHGFLPQFVFPLPKPSLLLKFFAKSSKSCQNKILEILRIDTQFHSLYSYTQIRDERGITVSNQGSNTG